MNADDLRKWADYLDNHNLPRPAGVDPTAAPELLEACKAAFDNLKPAYSSEHLVIKNLSVAIAHAEGKEEER